MLGLTLIHVNNRDPWCWLLPAPNNMVNLNHTCICLYICLYIHTYILHLYSISVSIIILISRSTTTREPCYNKKTVISGIGISIIKLISMVLWSTNYLIFIMVIPILEWWCLHTEMTPRVPNFHRSSDYVIKSHWYDGVAYIVTDYIIWKKISHFKI